jgi:hypothetical protein
MERARSQLLVRVVPSRAGRPPKKARRRWGAVVVNKIDSPGVSCGSPQTGSKEFHMAVPTAPAFRVLLVAGVRPESEPSPGPSPSQSQAFADSFRTLVSSAGQDFVRHLMGLCDALIAEHFAPYLGDSFPRVVPMVLECGSPRALADHCRRDAHGMEYRIRIAPSTVRHVAKAAADEEIDRFLSDVVLHELVHVEQSQGEDMEPGYKGHGPRFAQLCNLIGKRLGLAPVAARPRNSAETMKDCAYWPICVRPPGYYGSLEDFARRGEVRRRRKVAKLPPQPTTTQNPNGTETHDQENDDAGKDGRVKLLAASLRATASRLLRSQLLREQFQRFPELRAEVADLAAFADALAEEVGLPVAGGTIEALAGGVS